MSQKVFIIKLLLLHFATQSLTEIHANCNENVSLECPVDDIEKMDFSSVTWYKVTGSQKDGIIIKTKGNKAKKYASFLRDAEMGEKDSLLLSRVTAEDSGTYECFISANIGGKNQSPRINLTVKDCASQADLTSVPNVLNTTTLDPLCPKQVDLPVTWSVTGYGAVALTKIILSLVSIWVIRTFRASRQRRNMW